LEDYRQALRQAAAGLPQVTVIEGTELLEDREDLFYDKVHPNNAGMAQIAENITAHLLRANKS
jgi:lysophospholipase L1-like esterase